MPKFVTYLISIGVVIIFFVLGIGVGAYYHTELWVLWRGLTNNDTVVEPVTTPLTEDSTFITLPGIEGPLPVVFSKTLDEPTIQGLLKEGAVSLPLGTSFGDKGNMVVTAHSSGFESFGPYRFAFAKLSELTPGQEYTVTTPKAVYTYKVYGSEVVWPTEVDKLPKGDKSTVTLVTCWPLWTNFKRLLVFSELVKTEYRI